MDALCQKDLKTLFFFLVLATLGLAPPAHAQDITTGLVGHWKLDELTGTTTTDSSLKGNDGMMSGGLDAANDTTGGKIGTGLEFDGTDDSINIAGGAANFGTTDDFSISVWFKTTNTDSDTDAFFSNATSAGLWWYFGLNSSRQVRYFNDPEASSYSVVTPSAYNDGQWHNAILVRSNNGTDFRIYVDGGLEASLLGTTAHQVSRNSSDIGSYLNGNAHFYNESLDDVRIYNRALSAEDIAVLSSGTAPGGVRYNDETEAIEYHDGFDWVHAGLGSYSPNAVNFDGTNDYLRATSLNVSDSKKMTGSFWIRRREGGGRDIFETDGTYYTSLRFNATGNKLNIHAGDPAQTQEVLHIRTPNNLFTVDEWKHVMFSVDMSDTAKRHIYVDGVSNLLDAPTYITDAVMDFTRTTYDIGDSASLAYFDMADFWLDFGTYVDLSVQGNREKFRSANGAPMFLGHDGSLPLGRSPDIFLTGDTDEWHTNKGTGGGFTENGALTDATTQPGDSISAPSGCSEIGDICNDGSVFAGLTPDGNVEMYAMPNDSGNMAWNNGNSTGKVNVSTSYSDGDGNTATLIATDSDSGTAGVQPHLAAQTCANLVAHGHDDWYMPARGEVNVLYNNRTAIGGFTTGSYWTSHDAGQNFAPRLYFLNGVWSESVSKQNNGRVRCVRKAGSAAECANPTEPKGSILYNTDDKVMQYCNGTDWVAMGPIGGWGGSGCASPAGNAGDIIYNEDYNSLQYCSGDEWVAIGRTDYSTSSISQGLVGHWKLDETSGTTATDSAGSNNGTMAGGLDAANDAIKGKVGPAGLEFDGVDDEVTLCLDGCYAGPTTGTVTAWIKFDNLDTPNIIFAEEWTHTYRGLAFYVHANGGLRIWQRHGVSNIETAGTSVLNPNEWYHVAFISEGANYKMYVNGVDEGALTGGDTGRWFNYNNGGTNADYAIGKINRSGSALDGEFDGSLDDVRIYNRVLSPGEVNMLYQSRW